MQRLHDAWRWEFLPALEPVVCGICALPNHQYPRIAETGLLWRHTWPLNNDVGDCTVRKVGTTNQVSLEPAQSAQPAATPEDAGAAASATSDVAAPSEQLSGLAIRSRRPARASRASAPASSSANARDVTAALFTPAPVLQGPGLLEVFNRASARLQRFNDLAMNIAPNQRADIKALEARLRSGTSAIESARQALQALAELKIQQRLSLADIEYREDHLVSHFAQAAALHYGSCQKTIDEKMAQELDHVSTERVEMVMFDADAIRLQQPHAWLTLRACLLDAIGALEEVCQRIKSPMTGQGPRDLLKAKLPIIKATMGSCHERMQTVRGVLVEIHVRKLADQASVCGMPEVTERLEDLAQIDNATHAEVSEATRHVIQVRLERLSSTEHSLTPEQLAMYRNVLLEYAEIRGRVGMQLCLDAASLIEEGGHARDHLWSTMLDLAQALADQRQAIVDLCQFAVQDRQLMITTEAVPEQAPQAIPPSVSTTTSSRSRRSRKVRTQTTDASSSTAAPAQRATDERSAAQKSADEVLKGTALEASLVAELKGDFIELAKRLGKDTADVERLIGDSRYDAVTTFDFARTAMQGWFGSSSHLLQLRSKLPKADERIAQLTTRLGLVQTLERDFDRRQADALKTDPQPRAPHLERLLAMHGLAAVAAPRRLPSEGDRGNRGQLFEVRIEHTPQSNGELPAPWFVHLHTEKPVPPAALRSLPYQDFAAVHLKTAREVNLGPRWEEVMRALGHTDAKVHRATIGSKLLAKLWAAGSRGQG